MGASQSGIQRKLKARIVGLTEINGLPAHILLVHAVIILIPISVLLVLANVFWRGSHERLGVVTPLVALVTLLLVPVTTHAGEWLRDRVLNTSLIERHAHMGDSLLPWAFGLFIVAVASWYLRRRAVLVAPPSLATGTAPGESNRGVTKETPGVRSVPPAASIAMAAIAVVVSVGAIVQLYRIGDSGAQAAWHNNFSKVPISRPHHRH